MLGNLRIRGALLEDLELLFEWANDPVTRANSYSTAPIDHETHVHWFQQALNDPGVSIFIVEEDGVSIAQIRFSITSDGGMISFSVSPGSRGKGLSKHVLALGTNRIKAHHPDLRRVFGYVRKDNIPSVRAFERAGFTAVAEEPVHGVLSLRFEYDFAEHTRAH
jgi:UDP-2,4-diacetamido-2,4,6-trideoxy-beta-L-altropyranose hydrolase